MREPSRERVRALLSAASQQGRQRLLDWLLRDMHLRGVSFGEHSIMASPVGAGDILRWSGTGAPLAAMDLGMAADGHARAFVGGAAKNCLVTGDTAAGSIVQFFDPVATTAGPTTTSTASPPTVVLSEMTATITPLAATNRIRLSFNGSFTQGTNNASITVALFDGGTLIARSTRTHSANAVAPRTLSISIERWTTLSVAARTLDVRWAVSAGTGTAVGTDRGFQVVEFAA